MLRRFAVALAAALTVGVSSAQAAPACADLFRRATLSERAAAPVKRAVEPAARALAPLAKPITIPAARVAGAISSLVERLNAPRFQIERFDKALAYYRENGVDGVDRPRTREERIAFLHYVTTTQGRNPYDLETWARTIAKDISEAKSKQSVAAAEKSAKLLAKAIGKIDPEKGFSPTQIDSIYWRLFHYSASSPNAIRNIRRIGITQMDRIALEQWTTKELASHGAVEAFERLGLIRTQGFRTRMMDVLRRNPHVTVNLVAGALMIIEKQLLGSPVTLPNYSRLRVTKLSEELRTLVEEQGFDAAYPILKQKYGHLVQFDRRFYFARRAFTAGLMTYMLAHMIPTVVSFVVPPQLLEGNFSIVQITSETFHFWFDLNNVISANRKYDVDGRPLDANSLGEPTGPKVQVAPPGTVKTPPKINLNTISEHRVTITFDQQMAQETKPKPKPKAPPKADLGTQEQTVQAVEENLDYLNSLDFSDPTQR